MYYPQNVTQLKFLRYNTFSPPGWEIKQFVRPGVFNVKGKEKQPSFCSDKFACPQEVKARVSLCSSFPDSSNNKDTTSKKPAMMWIIAHKRRCNHCLTVDLNQWDWYAELCPKEKVCVQMATPSPKPKPSVKEAHVGTHLSSHYPQMQGICEDSWSFLPTESVIYLLLQEI